MRSSTTFFAVLLTLMPLSATSALGQSVGDDLGKAAATLLGSRCSSCHGPDSKEPRAVRAWPDATDLAATVANEDLVVPGDPDDSTLLFVIADGEMPPSDSGVTPLSTEETALITQWIEAGAPMPAPAESVDVAVEGEEPAATPGSTEPTKSEVKAPKAKSAGWMKKPVPKWLGHFHPLVVHFPLGLLTAALLAELLSRAMKKRELQSAASFCYTLGALAAVPSVAFGWLLAASTSNHGDELTYHRWLGVGTAALALLLLRPFYVKPGLRLPILLLLSALAGATGHLGGSLVYGSEWLDWPGW